MSLFDHLNCKYLLPRPENAVELKDFDLNSLNFQTKDLDNLMYLYEIRTDGTLWREDRETKWVEGDKRSKNFFEKLGHLKTIRSWWTQILNTQTIYFYESIRNDKYNNDYWIEFSAEFLQGKLISIKLIKFEADDNGIRKDREKTWEENMKKRAILFDKWYIKYSYVPYSRIIRYIFLKYNHLKQKLPSAWKIERFLTPL